MIQSKGNNANTRNMKKGYIESNEKVEKKGRREGEKVKGMNLEFKQTENH